jgi:hypothetical protein
MKRDMELIRKILFAIEGYDDYPIYNLEIDGYGSREISYHCSILFDARMVDDFNSLMKMDANLV